MAIPKKSAAAEQLRGTKPNPEQNQIKKAKTIFASDKEPREKITLTMPIGLKRELKAATAMEGTTISELLEQWAREWIKQHT